MSDLSCACTQAVQDAAVDVVVHGQIGTPGDVARPVALWVALDPGSALRAVWDDIRKEVRAGRDDARKEVRGI